MAAWSPGPRWAAARTPARSLARSRCFPSAASLSSEPRPSRRGRQGSETGLLLHGHALGDPRLRPSVPRSPLPRPGLSSTRILRDLQGEAPPPHTQGPGRDCQVDASATDSRLPLLGFGRESSGSPKPDSNRPSSGHLPRFLQGRCSSSNSSRFLRQTQVRPAEGLSVTQRSGVACEHPPPRPLPEIMALETGSVSPLERPAAEARRCPTRSGHESSVSPPPSRPKHSWSLFRPRRGLALAQRPSEPQQERPSHAPVTPHPGIVPVALLLQMEINAFCAGAVRSLTHFRTQIIETKA